MAPRKSKLLSFVTTGCLQHIFTTDLHRDFPQNSSCPHGVPSRCYQPFAPQHQTPVKETSIHSKMGQHINLHVKTPSHNKTPDTVHPAPTPPPNLILHSHVSVHLCSPSHLPPTVSISTSTDGSCVHSHGFQGR